MEVGPYEARRHMALQYAMPFPHRSITALIDDAIEVEVYLLGTTFEDDGGSADKPVEPIPDAGVSEIGIPMDVLKTGGPVDFTAADGKKFRIVPLE